MTEDLLDYKRFETIESETGTGAAAGSFTALVATWGVDRQRDRIVRGAFKDTLARWQAGGRMIPVMADHDGKVSAVVGRIDPRLTTETAQGLEASGSLDLSIELGQRVYELVKNGSLSWSIGFITHEGSRRQRGKISEITEIDLVEVSVVAAPANPEARTLSVKSQPPIDIVSFEIA